MRHIIIGGNGFVGRHLARRFLDMGEEVVVCDIERDPSLDIYERAKFLPIDITKDTDVERIPCGPDDIVHHQAARQYYQPVPKRHQRAFFEQTNCQGTERILRHMARHGSARMVFFSTDMVYGLPNTVPVPPTHARRPLGHYGWSKKRAEEVCDEYRARGTNITMFRPRLIIGPGRLGVLKKLFKLIDKGYPVPLIGDGSNQYQMVSVFDCVAAIEAAVNKGIPNRNYNLGSADPPSVEKLLTKLIASAGSRSRLIKSPARVMKSALATLERIGAPLLYREQYQIADVNYVVDISETIKDLGWIPQFGDEDMLFAAYDEYRRTN